VSPDSVLGRVARLEAIQKRASSMSEAEATTLASSITRDLDTEAPGPVKLAMVRCLARLPSPAAVDALRVALRQPDPQLRCEACRSLAQIDSPEAMSLLSETLAREQDVDAKLATVRALGRFRDPLAVQALGVALEDRDPAVQYAAMQSLHHSTGKDLGHDVRRWKELLSDPAVVLAERSRGGSR
jgi:HEAT repeat protein